MAKKMEESFYPNACHVCKAYGRNVELQRCSNCNIIAYCSEDHRKAHWPRHKKFCQVVSDIVKEFGTIDEFVGNWEQHERSCLARAEQFPRMVEMKLGRELTHNERVMLLYTRSCEICYENDPSKLKDCTDCPAASFCDEHPQDSTHSAKCSISTFRFELDQVVFELVSWTALQHDDHKYGDKIPENIDEAMEIYASNYHADKIPVSKKVWETLFSEKISCPYTFLYAMETLSLTRMTKMTIHLVDVAGIDCELDFWQSVLHHFTSLQELKMYVVGPTLNNKRHRLKCCDDCQAKKRSIILQNVGDTYENFAVGKFFSNPDCVFGFNIGIDTWLDLEIDNWTPAVETVAKLGCPFIVTSFTAKQSEADKKRIDTILEKKVDPFLTGPNPFSGLKPYEGSCENGGFFFGNQFLTIYEKLS